MSEDMWSKKGVLKSVVGTLLGFGILFLIVYSLALFGYYLPDMLEFVSNIPLLKPLLGELRLTGNLGELTNVIGILKNAYFGAIVVTLIFAFGVVISYAVFTGVTLIISLCHILGTSLIDKGLRLIKRGTKCI